MRIKLPIIVLTLLTYDLFSFSSCTFTFLHSPSLFLPRTHARVHTLFLLLSDSVPLCAVDAQIDTEQKIVEHGVRNLCTRITNGSRVESGTGRAAALSSLPVQTRRKPRAAKKKMARAVAPRTTQQYERVFFFFFFMYKLKGKSETITDSLPVFLFLSFLFCFLVLLLFLPFSLRPVRLLVITILIVRRSSPRPRELGSVHALVYTHIHTKRTGIATLRVYALQPMYAYVRNTIGWRAGSTQGNSDRSTNCLIQHR